MAELHDMIRGATEESVRRWRDRKATEFVRVAVVGDLGVIDPETGEKIGGNTGDDTGPTNIPAAFYRARPRLGMIRQAAHNRGRSADALLAVTLARTAVQVPPTIQLPPIVGSAATLDLLVALLARSGGGKSTSMSIGHELMPIYDHALVLDFPAGSGEGLVDAYLGQVEEVDDNGKKVKVRRQVKRGVLAEIDEGQVLTDLATRKGSTLLPTLRSAWSGSVLGQGNASVDTNRRLAPRAYRFAGIIALQPAHAIALLDDAPGGTPQRVLWFSAEDPTIPDDPPPWPGSLDVEVPPAAHYGLPYHFKVDDTVATEISHRSREKSRGKAAGADPLDAHADLLRLKVAALLAVIDDRLDVSTEDWELAGMVMTASRSVRTLVLETAKLDARRKEDAATARAVRREVAIVGTVEARALDRAARAIGKRAHRDPGDVLVRSKFTAAIASRDRSLVTVDDAIAEAERLGWIVEQGAGWTAGKAQPS